MKYFILSFLLCPVIFYGQSLSPERVAKIKSSTIKVNVIGGLSTGTGFFIDNNGTMATCWHVVLPAIENKKGIYIEFPNGDTLSVKIMDKILSDTSITIKAVAYDFCILIPVKKISRTFSFLKIGDFSTLKEGEEIYTCGYPLGHPQQFISKGIVSTKYVNSQWGVRNSLSRFIYMPREEALLDLTLNRGNSGGAIVKIGATPKEDVVIGIADFIINPLGNKADSIARSLSLSGGVMTNVIMDNNGKIISGNDPNKLGIIFSQAIGSLSVGVSGCVSVKYIQEVLKVIK